MRYYYWYTTRLPVQAKLPNWVAATDEPKANFSQRLNYTTCLQMLLLWPHMHQGEENLRREAETYFQGFEASLLFLQGSLLFSLVHFGERHAGVGQGRDRTGEGASS